jgi:hypothetical protein
MSITLMPAFHRYPHEAAIIGRLTAGYGELEYTMAECLGATLGDNESAFRAVFRLRTESGRLETVDALIRPILTATNLGAQYTQTIGAIRQCLKIRNELAHCHWTDDPRTGLYALNLQTSADRTEKFTQSWFPVSFSLLERQEMYFIYTMECFFYLTSEYSTRARGAAPHSFAMPPTRLQPNLHKAQGGYVPPWLIQDQ